MLVVLVLCLVSTDGSMVSGGSSSGIVVEWMGRLYCPLSVKRGGEVVRGETGGESV